MLGNGPIGSLPLGATEAPASASVNAALAATESSDTAALLARAELGEPILLDALSTETGWTAEWGSGGAWVAHANAATDLSRLGPAADSWVGVFTGSGYYTGTETGGRITKTITPVDLSARKNVGVWYALATAVSAESNPARLYNIQLYLGSDGDGSFTNAVVADFELGSGSSDTGTMENGAINHAIFDIASDFTTHAGTMDWSNVTDVRIVIYGSNGTALAAPGVATPRVYFQGLYANLYSHPVVVFTHDDGLVGVYDYARSRYAAQGWSTTQFVIPATLGTAGHIMTEANVATLYADGHDVCLHATYSGDTLSTLTGAQIDADLADGLDWLDTNSYSRSRHIVSWPQGVCRDSTGLLVWDRYVDQGVTVARGSARYHNSFDEGTWSAFDTTGNGKLVRSMFLKLCDVQQDRLPADKLAPALTKLVKYGGVLIINLHNVVASGATGQSINLADFEDTLALVAGYEANGLVTVKPLSQVFPQTDANLAATESPDTASFAVSISQPLEITTTALDPLQVGVAFSQQLVATGDEPITWSGTVPDGLTLSSTGLLSGTPTTAGAYSFTVTATNAGGSDDQAYTGTVEAANTGAGRSKRRRSKKYVVTIDGQDFVTESLEEAQALLDRAKALAVTQAQERAAEVVEQAIAKARRVGKAEVKVKPPTISAPEELSSQVDAIRQLYRDAAMAAEIQVLMALEAERDDEEVLLLSL